MRAPPRPNSSMARRVRSEASLTLAKPRATSASCWSTGMLRRASARRPKAAKAPAVCSEPAAAAAMFRLRKVRDCASSSAETPTIPASNCITRRCVAVVPSRSAVSVSCSANAANWIVSRTRTL